MLDRCKVGQLDNDSYSVQGTWHSILINQSIPWADGDDDTKTYDDCQIYSTNPNTSYNPMYMPINASKVDCDMWVYDQSVFKSTFITKVRWR